MSRYAVVALLALGLAATGSCVLAPEQQVIVVGHRLMDPVRASYAGWYTEVEECLGVRGNPGAVKWWQASDIIANGQTQYGMTRFPNEITIHWLVLESRQVVKHEMVHHVLQRGEAAHFDGSMECAGETMLDSG